MAYTGGTEHQKGAFWLTEDRQRRLRPQIEKAKGGRGRSISYNEGRYGVVLLPNDIQLSGKDRREEYIPTPSLCALPLCVQWVSCRQGRVYTPCILQYIVTLLALYVTLSDHCLITIDILSVRTPWSLSTLQGAYLLWRQRASVPSAATISAACSGSGSITAAAGRAPDSRAHISLDCSNAGQTRLTVYA